MRDQKANLIKWNTAMQQTQKNQQLVDNVRRDLIKRFFGVSLAATAMTPALLQQAMAMSKKPAQVDTSEYEKHSGFERVADVEPVKITDHVYVLYAKGTWPTPENQGFFANIYLVKTQKGIVVMDTGTSVQIGEMALRAIKRTFNQPVVAVINSHYHGDHWLGNHAFVEAYPNVPIYAHPDAKDAIKNAVGEHWFKQMMAATDGKIKGTQFYPPTEGVNHGEVLDFGDVHLKIHSYGGVHSPVDIMVEIVEDNALFVGDVLMEKRIGDAAETNFKNYIRVLATMRENLLHLLFMPGHGKPGGEALLSDFEDLMHGIYENAVKSVEDGSGLNGAREKVLADPRIVKHQNIEGFVDIGKYINIAYTQAEMDLF